MENLLRFKARKWRRQFVFLQRRQGGLAARSGTEFTWSPQLRNLAEGDWAPIFLAEKEDMEWRWVFARFYVLRRSNIKKRFSWSFFMKFLDIWRRDVWTVHGWLHFSWLGISASSFHIFKLREIYERLACSYSGNKTLFLILNTCYELTIIVSTSLATVIWEWSLNQFSTSRFVSLFVNREPQQIFIYFPVTLLHRSEEQLWLHDSVIFGAYHSSNHSNSPRRGCSNQNEA